MNEGQIKTWLHSHRHTILRLSLLFLALTVVAAIVLIPGPLTYNFQKNQIRIITIGKSPAADVAFWGNIEQGLQAAAREFNLSVEYRAPLDESHVDQQVNLVYQAIEEKPDAIILAAVEKYRLVEPARAARAAGIHVVIVDSSIVDENPVQESFVATDNKAAGRKLGELVSKLLPAGKKLLMVSPASRGDSVNDRETGVRELIGNQFNILPTLVVEGNATLVFEQVSKALAENPDISGIVCLNETTTAGAARAIRGTSLTGKVKLVGFDSSEELINYLEEGLLSAVVIQRPFNMGYLAVVHALDIIAGRRVEAFYDTGSLVVTKDMIYQEEIEKLIFPFD